MNDEQLINHAYRLYKSQRERENKPDDWHTINKWLREHYKSEIRARIHARNRAARVAREDAIISDLSNFKLCYCDQYGSAWFTSQDIKAQWGDDWNDVPFECNAGDPYAWREGNDCEPYVLLQCAYLSIFRLPGNVSSGGSCSYSVDMINDGEVPWLVLDDIKIYAGTTYPEFLAIMQAQVSRKTFVRGTDAYWLNPKKEQAE